MFGLYLLLGLALGVIIVGAIAGKWDPGFMREPCKGHSWGWTMFEGKEQLYCSKCKKSANQIMFDKE